MGYYWLRKKITVHSRGKQQEEETSPGKAQAGWGHGEEERCRRVGGSRAAHLGHSWGAIEERGLWCVGV